MTEAEVRRVHTESFYAALKTRDFFTLEGLYSERYMLIRSDGSVLNKQQVLKDLREQGLTFESITLEREEVRLFGSAAILSGKAGRYRPVMAKSPAHTLGSRLFTLKKTRPSVSYTSRVQTSLSSVGNTSEGRN